MEQHLYPQSWYVPRLIVIDNTLMTRLAVISRYSELVRSCTDDICVTSKHISLHPLKDFPGSNWTVEGWGLNVT